MPLHVLVLMPRGEREGVDFERVYRDHVEPGLAGAGLEVLRPAPGPLTRECLRELLLADLVVVDLSVRDPELSYGLGVRHALRSRGVLGIRAADRPQPRGPGEVGPAVLYHLKMGAPDPELGGRDRARLAEAALQALGPPPRGEESPVFGLLPRLTEIGWRSVLGEDPGGLWEGLGRAVAAGSAGRPGDVLVLAEEAPTRALRLEARQVAGRALRTLGRFELALAQFEDALAIDPSHLPSLRQKGFLLARLGRHGEAREHFRTLIQAHPSDTESRALLGDAEQAEWTRRWRRAGAPPAELRARAAAEADPLLAALRAHTEAFLLDPRHPHAGLQALTLGELHRHLGGDGEELPGLAGGVRWSCVAARLRDPDDTWVRAGLGDLAILSGEAEAAAREYRSAAERAGWPALDSLRDRLRILRDLEFRPEAVAAGLEAVEEALRRLPEPCSPRRVFVFSGHMIDRPERPSPRFPPDREPVAARAISARLDELGAREGDLAICGGACGGDLLFAQSSLARGLDLHLHLQFPEPEFLQASVSFAGQGWVDRYRRAREHPRATALVQTEELGPPPKGVNPYVRNNLWQLYTALCHGPEKVQVLALWDGSGGDGPGGTQHLVETVRAHSGRASVLRTQELW